MTVILIILIIIGINSIWSLCDKFACIIEDAKYNKSQKLINSIDQQPSFLAPYGNSINLDYDISLKSDREIATDQVKEKLSVFDK